MSNRNWCFTVNNPTEDKPFEFNEIKMKYLVYQKEVGESGTPHFQGYLRLVRDQRISFLKKLHPTAHWEIARGSGEENKIYCTKEEGRIDGPWEFGELQQQGKRNDILAAVETIKASKRKIGDVIEQHPEVYVKYHKGLEKIARHYTCEETKEFRDLDVQVYWGKTGTGKTRKAVEENPSHYILRNEQTIWFDGYDGQDTLIIDEFKNWIQITTLLGYLDGYQLRLPIKGDFTYANWKKVIITSNIDPREWYPNVDQEHKDALFRRIKNIIHFDSL